MVNYQLMVDYYKASTFISATGLSRVEYDQWKARGFIKAACSTTGTGKAHFYTIEEIFTASLARALVLIGIPPAKAFTYARWLNPNLSETEIAAFCTDQAMYISPSSEVGPLVDLGQAVALIPLAPIVSRLNRAIAKEEGR